MPLHCHAGQGRAGQGRAGRGAGGAGAEAGRRTPRGTLEPWAPRRASAAGAELVAAAADLLRSGGFDAVRHRAVAERAGLPLSSTTYYFDSLDDLVVAATERTSRDELAEGRARLDALAEGPPDTAALIEIVLDQLLGPESRDGGLDAVLLRYERLVGAGRRPYLAPLMRRLRGELDALLAEVLARCGRPLDPDGVARARRARRRVRGERTHRGRPGSARDGPRGAVARARSVGCN